MGLGRAAESLVQIATSQGFAVAASGPNRFRFAKTFRPTWANVLTLVLAPFMGLGLLFLLVKRTEACEAILIEDRAGVRINLSGDVSPGLFVAIHDALSSGESDAMSMPMPTAFAPQAVPPPTLANALHPAPMAAPASTPSFAAPDDRTMTVAQLAAMRAPENDRTMTVAQMAAMRTTVAPSLRFIDGRMVPVGAGLVLGRNPDGDAQLPSAQLVPVNDPSLSKTHASFGPTPRGIWVQDHHSTNGTSVQLEGSTTMCQPGARVEVPIGAAVVLGEVHLAVVADAR